MSTIKQRVGDAASRAARFAWDVAQAGRRWYWRTFRVETRGVRVAALRPASGAADGEEILLVRHRYGDLWVMPGGGVNRREAPAVAAARELLEETGLAPEGPLVPLGVFRNEREGKRDTVSAFVAERVAGTLADPSFEIARLAWWPLPFLPDGTSAATRRRVAEILAWREGRLSLPLPEVGEW